ncbi:MAG: NarK family nitrate/nitrite MFS transporter [Actinomycetota bacterium]|nr:NarK family nitrate/nitrite MFS transporter [Actinomycetota bacterium]
MSSESQALIDSEGAGTLGRSEDEILGRTSGRWVHHWEPEDQTFWESIGARVAKRNLQFSIYAEFLGFSVWLLWSVIAVKLNDVGFAFSADQLFWLVAIPSLVGALLRLPYTFAVPKFGGRNWTIISALLLVIPCLGLAWAVSHPSTPFWAMLLIAATAGFGGGNFASSMANISFFYPEKEKGWALGLNAAGGNIGVAFVQAPFIISAIVVIGGGLTLARAGWVWLPFIALAAFLAWKLMDNLSDAKADFASSAKAAHRSNTWIMAFLYVGTFGSFIGFAAAFPLLIKTQFPDINALTFAFIGALVGSLIRPLGGRLADRFGGAIVTIFAFFVMTLGVLGAIWSISLKSFPLFLATFILLFASTGIANGSTYRMIPAIFQAKALIGGSSVMQARRESAAAIGIISAVGAFGGFLVPRTFAWSTGTYGSMVPAFLAYTTLYLVMATVTWFFYKRPGSLLAEAGV